MKVFILAILFVGAIATESDENDEEVQVDEAQFPMMPQMMGMGMGMGMNPMMMNQMNPMMGMNSMMGMGMRGQGNQFQSPQGYAVDYNLPCSSNCGCAQMCIPMMPCQCTCPPPCPPQQQPPVEGPPQPKCVNGAPDHTYPDCCHNTGRGEFCCLNGANNLHCCLNGANNPWCSLPTIPPVNIVPTAPPGGDDCNQCRCQPCIPWMPCQPCPCQQRCGGFGK